MIDKKKLLEVKIEEVKKRLKRARHEEDNITAIFRLKDIKSNYEEEYIKIVESN